ncbi:MAG TPA: hypothetical protein VHX61_16330 [Rhizomicrobium sp.]|jgi:hypothetical protein|nr:hypothetical protein [Rhizomicrobium sp.]
MQLRNAFGMLLAFAVLAACSVYPMGQDADGLNLRRDANRVMMAIEQWHHARRTFPQTLSELVPRYLPSLPDAPKLVYHAHDGSLSFRYIPTWPQLRPVWCSSVGDTTNWICAEHLLVS